MHLRRGSTQLSLTANDIARASSNASLDYLATIRPTAFTAERINKLDPEPQVSLRVVALKAAMATQDTAWRERMSSKDAVHQRQVAALEATNQSLTARLNQEDWTGPEQILEEALRLVRNQNTKLWAQGYRCKLEAGECKDPERHSQDRRPGKGTQGIKGKPCGL